ncbi:hypothetical protein MUNTM_21290 [Mycobacterium sp. MUNTM1]
MSRTQIRRYRGGGSAAIAPAAAFRDVPIWRAIARIDNPLKGVEILDLHPILHCDHPSEVPTLRHPRTSTARLVNKPNREPTANTAGARVSAAKTMTSSAIAQGSPMVWK